MIRYVTYRRVSTKEQGRSGLGLDAQERDIRLYLENYSEEPWEIIATFTEVQSGSESDRPVLKEAVEAAKKADAVLLVSKIDRLGRKVSLVSALMDDKRLKLRVASMPNAPKFQLHIYAALAEQEREFISTRTKAALKEAKAKGKTLGGLRDKTMRRNNVLKAQADARAQKLEGIVIPMKERGDTLQAIAEALNKANVRTARGGTWHPTSVKRLIDRLATGEAA